MNLAFTNVELNWYRIKRVICLQIQTVLWMDGGTTCQLLMFSRQVQTRELLILSLVPLSLRWSLENLKDIDYRYWSNVDITEGKSILWEPLILNSIQNEEEMPWQWKESIILPVYKKGDKLDCINYHWISLLSTKYKNLSSIPLFLLDAYVDTIIRDHQCGFWQDINYIKHSAFVTYFIKWKYSEAVKKFPL